MRLEPLDTANQEAFALYRVTATQIVADLHLGGYLLDRLLGDASLDEMTDILERMSMIHATMNRIAEQRAKRENG